MIEPNQHVREMPMVALESGSLPARVDWVTVEEPLEIRIVHGPSHRRCRDRLTVTLRTPGDDVDLAFGLLHSEGIIENAEDVIGFRSSADADVLTLELHPRIEVDLQKLSRWMMATAACGLCGKTTLESLETACEPSTADWQVARSVLLNLPAKLKQAQTIFSHTGGLHAAALFDPDGNLLAVFEDIGRHNALDKLLGHELRQGRSRLENRMLMLSGRAGFELIQKAARSGIPIVAAIGAATSLAVRLAHQQGISLIAFLRDGRGNCYTHAHRIDGNR